MRILAMILVSGILASCGDSAGPSQVGRDSSEAGIFARIGDVPWGSDQGPTEIVGVWDPGTGFRVQGSVTRGGWTHTLTMDAGNVGTQAITPQAYPIVPTGASYMVKPSSSFEGMKLYQSLQGRFRIDSYDPATRYMVGTFAFEAVQTDGPDWTPDVLPVRNGTFRGIIRIK